LKLNAANYGFNVEEIPRQDVDHISVSSSKIRQALENSQIEIATQLLGRPYMISGQVVQGDQLGRELGFPTANIEVDSRYKLIPADGIYAVTVSYENKIFKGMLYIGPRPTVNGTQRVIEVNLFDFDKDIYGDRLTVHLHQFIREDKKFDSLETLKQQLHWDKTEAMKRLETITFAKPHGTT